MRQKLLKPRSLLGAVILCLMLPQAVSAQYPGLKRRVTTDSLLVRDIAQFDSTARFLDAGVTPFTVVSNTLVSNLNSDLLDSQTGSWYVDSANFTGTDWTDLTDAGETALHIHDARYYREGELDTLLAAKEDTISAGTTSQYWRGDKSWQTLNTSVVPESGSLYFTDERVDDRVDALIQDGTGITWTYVDASGTLTGVVSLSPFSTTDLSEGTNLYWTNARGDARYYTETELDAGQLDNRYFTETESDARFSPVAGSASIVTVGTIGTGTWQGTIIDEAYLDHSWGSDATFDTIFVTLTDFGTNTIVDADIGNWDTAHGWGDHSTQNYMDLDTQDHGDTGGLADDDHTQYHTDARALTWFGTRSTSDLSEGTNLYWTQTRFNTAFTAKSTTDLSEGTNLYYTDARVDTRVQGAGQDYTIAGAWTFSDSIYYTDAQNAGADVDRFLVLDAGNVVDYRTGAEVLSDIGAEGSLTKGNLTASAPISLDQTRQVIGGAAVISHSTSAGYKHVPTAGASNNVLIYGGASGTASWGQDYSQWNTAYSERGSQIAGDHLTWDGSELDVGDDWWNSFADMALTADYILKGSAGNVVEAFAKGSNNTVLETNGSGYLAWKAYADWETAYGWGNHAAGSYADSTTLKTHLDDTADPHSVTKAQVGLSNVENTALSTWAGTANVTTLGTIGTGTWQATVIDSAYIDPDFVTTYELNQWTGSASVTTLGTIGTGVWQATVIDEAYLDHTWTSTFYLGTLDLGTNTITDGNLTGAWTGITNLTASGTVQAEHLYSTDDAVIDGTLGVGKSVPVSPLHVYQNTGDVGTGAGLTIEQDGTGDAVAQFQLTGVTRWVIGADNSDGDKFKIASSADLNSNAHLIIDTGGNVGIGTTGPTTVFSVTGSDHSNQGQVVIVDKDYASTNVASKAFLTGYGSDISGATGKLWLLGSASSTSNNVAFQNIIADASLYLTTAGTGDVVLAPGGDVSVNASMGIGNDSPSYTLDVTGDIRVTDDLFVNDDIFQGDGDVHYFGDGNDMSSYHDGTVGCIVSDTGNLRLYGSEVEFNYDGRGDAKFFTSSGAGENRYVYIYGDDGGAVKWGTHAILGTGTYEIKAQEALALRTLAGQHMYFDAGGNYYWRDVDAAYANRATINSATGDLWLYNDADIDGDLNVDGSAVVDGSFRNDTAFQGVYEAGHDASFFENAVVGDEDRKLYIYGWETFTNAKRWGKNYILPMSGHYIIMAEIGLELVASAGDVNIAASAGKDMYMSAGGTFIWYDTDDPGAERMTLVSADGKLKLLWATEDLELVDAGSAGATEQDWIEVTVGGNTGYIRVYAAK